MSRASFWVCIVPAGLVAVSALAGCDVFNHGDEELSGLIGVQFVPAYIDQSGVEAGVETTEVPVLPGTFLAAAKDRINRPVTRVQLTAVRIKINQPTVAAWTAIYSGEVTMAFIPAADKTAVINVAHGTPPASLDDFNLTVTAGDKTFDGFPDIAAGDFHLRITGPTTRQATDTFGQLVLVQMEFLVF